MMTAVVSDALADLFSYATPEIFNEAARLHQDGTVEITADSILFAGKIA